MPAKLAILPDAKQDLNDGFRWYASQQAGLGTRFLAAVNGCITGILRSPKMGRVVHGPYRRAVVPRWRYVIFYEYDEPSDTVIVHVVFHTSQNPAKWQQRLP